VSSQRNFSNSFIVDGLSANDDAAGLSGIFYGLDVVNEFQVVTSGGQAEFGRALGGYMNVITKSGTNGLHGDLYGYFRNSRLNAANALSNTVLPLTQAQYGASLGGPVFRDRTFYFVNFEQRELNQSGLITTGGSWKFGNNIDPGVLSWAVRLNWISDSGTPKRLAANSLVARASASAISSLVSLAGIHAGHSDPAKNCQAVLLLRAESDREHAVGGARVNRPRVMWIDCERINEIRG
jgi:hypothetical protein